MNAYMLATAPCRWWIRKQARRTGDMPVTGIFLHRVADDDPNPWSMTNRQFDDLIGWLEKHVDLVSTDEAQRRIREGNRERVAVNITFDDGYADNCMHAIPTLLSKKIPFTYYVTTDNVKTGEPYPHDLKNNQRLAPNSIDEIKAMSDAGVTIGVHTRTHADMGKVTDLSAIEYEIGGARDDLTQWTGTQPIHFAFPFGMPMNMTPKAIQYVADQGFASYSSAHGGYNFPFRDSFHLRRFHGDPMLARMKNWLSLDPRWIWRQSELDYIPFTRPHAETASDVAGSL